MSLLSKSKRIFTTLIVFSFFSLGVQNVSIAAMVSSSDMVAAQQNQLSRDQIKTWMAREDVREQLVDMGVDVEVAIIVGVEVEATSTNSNGRSSNGSDASVRNLSTKSPDANSGLEPMIPTKLSTGTLRVSSNNDDNSAATI